MIPFGGDFAYQQSELDLSTLERFMDYFNALPENKNITLIYSTPSEYLESLYK
jgi:hypothetical protein